MQGLKIKNKVYLENHKKYMRRAIELAKNGLGGTSPNPSVGCVIVKNGTIIGEGFTSPYGGAHAEVNAINSVKDQTLLISSTLYVTLEPCAHYGKTPPCSDLIIKHKIPEVIICCTDPFEEVNGEGIKRLKKNGVKIKVGVLEQEGLDVNRRFFTSINKKRPYIILKWAQTKDGFVAKENFDSKWISNSTSRKIVHIWRSLEDSILVGFNTTKFDNPELTVRDIKGVNPTRIVIDENLELNNQLHLFDNNTKTICFNAKKTNSSKNLAFIKVDFNNLEQNILDELYRQNIHSLIVEGGSKTLQKFINKNLWDEARVFIGNNCFEKGIKSPTLSREPDKKVSIIEDKLFFYRNV